MPSLSFASDQTKASRLTGTMFLRDFLQSYSASDQALSKQRAPKHAAGRVLPPCPGALSRSYANPLVLGRCRAECGAECRVLERRPKRSMSFSSKVKKLAGLGATLNETAVVAADQVYQARGHLRRMVVPGWRLDARDVFVRLQI